jgi:hypothetical protein
MFPRLFASAAAARPESRREFLSLLCLGAAAFAFYSLALHWGLPAANAPGMIRPWGVDEIAPLGPLAEIHTLLARSVPGNPQYTMCHYFILASFYAPYLLLLFLTGDFSSPSAEFPFGFADPVAALHALTMIGRGVSALAGAGTAIAAYFFAKSLWDRASGYLAAVLVMLSYPVAYYSRVSNVDLPAMFWTACMMVLLARGLREGFSLARIIVLGALAALAVATKDQNVAVLLPFAPAVVAWSLRSAPPQFSIPRKLAHLAFGGAISLALYAVLSGFVFWPERFWRHVDFLRHGSMRGRWYFRYDLTLEGLAGLFRELGMHVVECGGWVVLIAALAGMAVCWRRQREHLLFLAPAFSLLFIVLLPVRYLAVRFLIPVAFMLACFAACALARGLRSERRWLRGGALAVFVLASASLLARDADVVYLMWNDPRHAASEWLERHVRPDEKAEAFMFLTGHPVANWFPRMPHGVPLDTVVGLPRKKWLLTKDPDDLVYRFYAPGRIYDDLLSGRLCYERRACFKTASLFEHPSLELQLNPRICIFERREPARAASPGSGVK